MAMVPEMLRRDRDRWGISPGECAWRLGITRREYVAIEAGEKPPTSDEYEAIVAFFGWPGAHPTARRL
jgi:hypothetical protein